MRLCDEHRNVKSVLQMTAAGFYNFSFQFIPFVVVDFFLILLHNIEKNPGSLK